MRCVMFVWAISVAGFGLANAQDFTPEEEQELPGLWKVTPTITLGLAFPMGQLGQFGTRTGFAGEVGADFQYYPPTIPIPPPERLSYRIGALYSQMPAAGGNEVVNWGFFGGASFLALVEGNLCGGMTLSFGAGLGLFGSRCGPPGVLPGNFGPGGYLGADLEFPGDFGLEFKYWRLPDIQGFENQKLTVGVKYNF